MVTERLANSKRSLTWRGRGVLYLLALSLALLQGGCSNSGGGQGGTTPATPNIASLNPSSGAAGASVTITGANFGASQGSSTVSFNGTAATPTSWSATSIAATVPAGATTGNVVVTVGGVASNGIAFTVTSGSAPSITSLTPTSGPAGTSVTIAGANFGTSQGTSTLTFNGTAATPNSWSATSIVAAVPAGATTGNVVVTVGGVASNGLTFTVGTATGSKFPIGASANGRYFVDATGAPWLMVGDSAHHIVNVLVASYWPTYFASRQSMGFNTVNIMSCAHGNCPPTGATADGQIPFSGTIQSTCNGTPRTDYDLSTPRSAYWVELDNFVNMAASYGLVVLFDPLTTADYINDLRASGPTKAFGFGAYLGNRYKSFPNIIWELGNDFQTWRQTTATCPGTVTDNMLVQQLMAGIASADTNHIQTIQLDYYGSYSNQDSGVSSYLKADAAYTYYETYDYVRQAYNSSPVSPVFLAEANMEGANNTGALCALADARVLRHQMYWTMTSGASGHVWGNTHVNHSDSTWQSQLSTPATAQVALLTKVFQQIQWWKLVPDAAHQVVTAGFGTANTGNENLCTSTYATAAWVPDSATPTLASAAVVYTPVSTTTPLSVNMSMFSKAVSASWYDPTTGNPMPIVGSFANSGTQSFPIPSAAHSDGTNDWVLVLQ